MINHHQGKSKVMNLNETSTPRDTGKYALALAATLKTRDEITLGPTDQELCAKALKAYAAQFITARPT